MNYSIKNLGAGIGLSVFCTLPAYADGIDQMFTADGNYIDEIEVIGDVEVASGETMALLEMRAQHMKFYVDPDAIYVTMDENNPILTENKPFFGFWVSTQSPDISDWPNCGYNVVDEHGTPYDAHGTLVWTNTDIAPNGYSLAYSIDIGICEKGQQPWAYSRASIEMSPDAGVPHGDIPDQNIYTITDSKGAEYTVEANDGWAVLTSVEAREIVVPMADTEQSSQTYFEQDVLNMYADCVTGSVHYGYGTWSWANGGFIIDFDNVSFSFPRMDAPPNNDGACRM
ncbi:hypothetical protein EBB79_11410 [Parasedimentitalea marina]|uniref:Uncharacterized protein n=1 Tax=Parasedimentitalea marina TaxID=2483033 RepID=A0A3T0N362_9RHOB|nr:hypothetical protein [Parasedimentitalea marina]AZV78427.1 hypothetical protein EBB79_11410 [Parasedimentitalea marina]